MRWKVAGINFDHFHMGDLLRMVDDHPDAEIAAIADEHPERMAEAARQFRIPGGKVYADAETCLAETEPDLVILCPAAAHHAEWVEKVAPFRVPVLVEKPFAASLSEADRMIAAMEASGQPLAINWPLAWVASHIRTRELIAEGAIGEVIEVHFYDGNRGPLWHGADKIEREPSVEEKADSWFYSPEAGGGSLLDYLGYGTTLGTWFNGGQKPSEVTAMWHRPAGLDVDEHSVTIARYRHGLSTFETRWGTFSDPWTNQPQPKCGFVIRGSEGTIASYDYEPTVRLQTREHPGGIEVDAPKPSFPRHNPVAYVLDRLESGQPIEGPLGIEISRIGQQIVDTALASAREGRTIPLLG